MLKTFRRFIRALKIRKDVKGMIKYQYRVDDAIRNRPALAGISVEHIPFKYRKDVLLLPHGQIVCVGAGTLLPKLDGYQYHYCNSTDDVTIGSIVLTSGSVIVEEHITSNRLTCYYVV